MQHTCCAHSHSHLLFFPSSNLLPSCSNNLSLSLALAHTATETAAFIFKSNESEIAGAPLSAHYTPLAYTFAGGLRKWSKHEIDIINTQLETLQMSFDETETAREAPRATTTGFCVALLILLLLLLLLCSERK